MSNELRIFENEQFGRVRTVLIDGEPWFVGKDVATALGYERADNAIRKHIDKEDKLMHQIGASGQNRGMYIINESGMYSLILSSKLPTAKAFKHWVTSEILPSIRKHGCYVSEHVLDDFLGNIDNAIAVFTALKKERERAQQLSARNRMFEAKSRYLDIITDCINTVPITVIAKDYGLSGVRFNEMLRQMGIQFSVNGTWVLNQKYAGRGYTQTRTYLIAEDKAAIHTLWTQKGRLFLYELLKKEGIYPECERNVNFTVYED